MKNNLSVIASKHGISIDEGEKSSRIDKSLSLTKKVKIKHNLIELMGEFDSIDGSLNVVRDTLNEAVEKLSITKNNSENMDSLIYLNELLDNSQKMTTLLDEMKHKVML